MFKTYNTLLSFELEDGMKIVSHGFVDLYEPQGSYQLNIREILPEGLGELYIAFEQLKKKLEKEGLFDEKYKKPIPKFPTRIGIVTSPTGAAIQDILRVIERRYPLAHILLAPSLVQGRDAAPTIVHAIELLNSVGVDVIIVCRGGGSLEDLWPFNEEIVARAIFNSKIPIISAVGHEPDVTIADYVADKRAATPSAAGELVVPIKEEISRHLDALSTLLKNIMYSKVEACKSDLDGVNVKMVYKLLQEEVGQYGQRIDELLDQTYTQVTHKIELQKESLDGISGKLDALSPIRVLERGYSISLKLPTEELVENISVVKGGDKMKVIVKDGEIICEVEKQRRGTIGKRR